VNQVRVALITNILAHYRLPCFRFLADRFSGGIDFYYLSSGMEHRRYVMARPGEKFPATLLRGWKAGRYPHDDCHLSDIRPVLRRNPQAVILGGWDEPTYLALWAWAVARRKRLIFWVESTEKDSVRRGLRESGKRFLLGQAAACIVPGRSAHEYCRQLGVSEDRIYTAPNSTDREYFRTNADRLLPRRKALKEEAGLNGFVVLFVGRLVESLKGVSTLIKACAGVQRQKSDVSLLIAGEGPDRKNYEALIEAEGLNNSRFLGTLDHEKLCRYYAMADVLVQPSRSEPWGFVLNEGMEFGLPLIVSNAVGAAPDLVQPGRNGFVFPTGDACSLACILQKLNKNESLRSGMGNASRKIIEDFSPDRWARGVLTALEAVITP
jgi:glycosyltransferase involved in cell wall biosynthesis